MFVYQFHSAYSSFYRWLLFSEKFAVPPPTTHTQSAVVLLKSALISSHLPFGACKTDLATSQRECQSRWAGLGETSDNRGHSPVLPPRQLTAYRSTSLQLDSLAVNSASLWRAIGMASAKDTATFFTHGTCQQYEQVLGLYQQALRLKADRKAKKPEELIKLDNW